LESINGLFHAVHVRHADMKSNYQPIIADLKTKDIETLFVATDNRQVLQDFKDQLNTANIISFSALPEIPEQKLHARQHLNISINRVNRDAILDLFTMSFAEQLYMCKVINNPFGEYSGYSRLAKTLRENPLLRNEFLVQPSYQPR
jgi:hypothetical protein